LYNQISNIQKTTFDLLAALTHPGQPSNVDTVNNVSIALATSSKLNLFFCHERSSTFGWLVSPSSYLRYWPLQDSDTC